MHTTQPEVSFFRPPAEWEPLTGNKGNFTEAYLAWWFQELAAREETPKLMAKAKIYAKIIVETHDLQNGQAEKKSWRNLEERGGP